MNAEELQPARKVLAASNRGRRHDFLECHGFLDSFGALSLRLPRQPKANIIVHLVMMMTLVTVASATTISMVSMVFGLKMTATMSAVLIITVVLNAVLPNHWDYTCSL